MLGDNFKAMMLKISHVMSLFCTELRLSITQYQFSSSYSVKMCSFVFVFGKQLVWEQSGTYFVNASIVLSIFSPHPGSKQRVDDGNREPQTE